MQYLVLSDLGQGLATVFGNRFQAKGVAGMINVLCNKVSTVYIPGIYGWGAWDSEAHWATGGANVAVRYCSTNLRPPHFRTLKEVWSHRRDTCRRHVAFAEIVTHLGVDRVAPRR